MEEIRIPNDATYAPIALSDIMLAAPLASRILLGVSPVGRALQLAALGLYAGSALRDWVERQGVRPIDFRAEFGADGKHLRPLSREARESEARELTERLNDAWVPERIERRELAVEVDRHITAYIADITGQRVVTSTEVRDFSLAAIFFPFALGSYDILSGDIAIYRDTGVFEPHVIAHEICHRKGWWRELDAQVLAYLALVSSGEPVLVQSALAERLHRDLRVLAGDDDDAYQDRVERIGLREELLPQLVGVRRETGPIEREIVTTLKTIYDARLKLTGQNGISDYDLGFTNFLYTFETSASARRVPPSVGRVHRAA